jgi:hypothetical protein
MDDAEYPRHPAVIGVTGELLNTLAQKVFWDGGARQKRHCEQARAPAHTSRISPASKPFRSASTMPASRRSSG